MKPHFCHLDRGPLCSVSCTQIACGADGAHLGGLDNGWSKCVLVSMPVGHTSVVDDGHLGGLDNAPSKCLLVKPGGAHVNRISELWANVNRVVVPFFGL